MRIIKTFLFVPPYANVFFVGIFFDSFLCDIIRHRPWWAMMFLAFALFDVISLERQGIFDEAA